MSDDKTTDDRLREQCEAVRNNFVTLEKGREYSSHDADDMSAELRESLEDLGWDGEGWTLDDFLAESDDCLGLVFEKGEPLRVTLCWGGPNVYLTHDSNNGGAIEGHWGGARHTLTGPDVDRMAEHWLDVAKMLDEC